MGWISFKISDKIFWYLVAESEGLQMHMSIIQWRTHCIAVMSLSKIVFIKVCLMLLIHVFCIVFVLFGKTGFLYCYANKKLESWIISEYEAS